jgi:hypothetical protein
MLGMREADRLSYGTSRAGTRRQNHQSTSLERYSSLLDSRAHVEEQAYQPQSSGTSSTLFWDIEQSNWIQICSHIASFFRIED